MKITRNDSLLNTSSVLSTRKNIRSSHPTSPKWGHLRICFAGFQKPWTFTTSGPSLKSHIRVAPFSFEFVSHGTIFIYAPRDGPPPVMFYVIDPRFPSRRSRTSCSITGPFYFLFPDSLFEVSLAFKVLICSLRCRCLRGPNFLLEDSLLSKS